MRHDDGEMVPPMASEPPPPPPLPDGTPSRPYRGLGGPRVAGRFWTNDDGWVVMVTDPARPDLDLPFRPDRTVENLIREWSVEADLVADQARQLPASMALTRTRMEGRVSDLRACVAELREVPGTAAYESLRQHVEADHEALRRVWALVERWDCDNPSGAGLWGDRVYRRFGNELRRAVLGDG